MNVLRSEVKIGEFWNCCDTDTVELAGAFDAEDGSVVWHGLCNACAATYLRTVKGAEVATIIDDARFIVDTLRLTAPRNETTIAMDPRDVLTLLAIAEADGIDVRNVYAYGGSFRYRDIHVIFSKAAV